METLPKRIVIVNHQGPDTDSIACTFKLLKALGKVLNAPDIVYKFVEPGYCISPQEIEPGDIVYHLDTGFIYDPENGYFDHHHNTMRWPSAARTLLEWFEVLRKDPIMRDLADLIDNVDSAGRVGREDDEAYLKRESFKNEVTKFNALRDDGRIMLVTERPGPKSLTNIISNMEVEIGEIEDRDKLLTGIIMLETWYEQESQRRAGDEVPVDNFELADFDRIVSTYINLVNTNSWISNTPVEEIENLYATATKSGCTSAAESALKNLSSQVPYRYVLQEMVNLVNQLYKTGSSYPESPEAGQKIKELEIELAEFNANRERKIVPLLLRNGPWEIVDHYPSAKYSKRVQILSVLFMLRAYFNRRTIRSQVNRMIDNCRFFEANNVKYLDVMGTTFTTKTLRFQLRHNHQDKVDVSIATHINPYTGEKTLSVTKLQDDELFGIEELYYQLVKIEPTADINLIGGKSKFAIYIKSNLGVFTPEMIKQIAVRTLRSGEFEPSLSCTFNESVVAEV